LKALKKEADERLLIEAAQKDPACFAELYEVNFERVYAYVVRRVGNRTETEDLTADDSGVIESAQASPVEIEDVERRATLFRLVDTLPAEQRRVVVLRFVEQKSIKEVAREIRKTEGAVKQLQFRALSSLRTRMEGADA
jgi:DNA-directed RNA polymerase specialized sigma24 family protein